MPKSICRHGQQSQSSIFDQRILRAKTNPEGPKKKIIIQNKKVPQLLEGLLCTFNLALVLLRQRNELAREILFGEGHSIGGEVPPVVLVDGSDIASEVLVFVIEVLIGKLLCGHSNINRMGADH